MKQYKVEITIKNEPRYLLMCKQGRGQLHIEYKNLLLESFNPLITHIYFIQKDKSKFIEANYIPV